VRRGVIEQTAKIGTERKKDFLTRLAGLTPELSRANRSFWKRDDAYGTSLRSPHCAAEVAIGLRADKGRVRR
jgi:hypothetical protein